MRRLVVSLIASIVLAVLGGLVVKIALFGHTTVVYKAPLGAFPTSRTDGPFTPMTDARCRAIWSGEPAEQIHATYGVDRGEAVAGDAGTDWSSIAYTWPGAQDYYQINSLKWCMVFYGVHDNVRFVLEELL